MKCNVGTTIIPTPKLRMFHSPKKCERYLTDRGVRFNPIDACDAQTWFVTGQKGQTAVVLCSMDQNSPWQQQVAMLAHEATHIALWTLEAIGETEPGEEETCYLVQAITLELVTAHFLWRERRHGADHG